MTVPATKKGRPDKVGAAPQGLGGSRLDCTPDADPLALARLLTDQGVPVWVAAPTPTNEFARPSGWQKLDADGNNERLSTWRPGMAVCANTGTTLTVFDVDPRNGGNIDLTRMFLDANNIRVFAEVETPSGGMHFYVTGDPRLTSKKTVMAAYVPGVDFQSAGCNVFIPGTERGKYDGRGYVLAVDNGLDTLAEGDADGGQTLVDLVGAVGRSTDVDTTAVTVAQAAAILTDGDPDTQVAEATEAAVAQLGGAQRQGQSRHATALTVAGRLLRLGEKQHPGVAAAVESLRTLFAGLIPDRATPEVARSEFDAIVDYMARVVAADPSTSWAVVDAFEPSPPTPEAQFWTERPSLATVKQMSDARTESAWSVLGVVLCLALADVPPWVQLPAIVGSRASLNFAVALVGPSGSGKSAAVHIGRELWPSGDGDLLCPVGSGEGLAARYVEPRSRNKGRGGETHEEFAAKVAADGPMVWHRQNSVFTVDEIGELTGLTERGGYTGMAKIRTMWSGGELGNQNATAERNRRTGSHTYRATLIVGVQPDAAGLLLDDHGTGTPQRFLWMPSDEFDEVEAVEPGPLDTWPTRARSDGEVFEVPVPDSIRAEVKANHIALKRGGDAYSGHAMLCRLKTAVALAVLDLRIEVTEDDWRLAGVVMGVSDRTRNKCVNRAEQKKRAATVASGRLQGLQSVAAAEVIAAQSAEGLRGKVIGWLEGGPVSRRAIEAKRAGDKRAALREVIDDLIAEGVVREIPQSTGKKMLELAG